MSRFHRSMIAAAVRHVVSGSPGTGGGTGGGSTPPSGPGSPYGANTVLWMPLQGDFSELTGKTVSAVNVVFDTNTVEFGNTSARFNGSNAEITIPASSDFDFGTGDFAIEMRTNFVSTDNLRALFSIRNGTSSPLVFGLYNGQFFLWNGNFIIQAGSPSLGTWKHLELSRTDGVVYLFYSGELVAETPCTAYFGGLQAPAYIGGDPNWNQFTDDFIIEVLVAKGKGGHTAPFAPPSAPY